MLLLWGAWCSESIENQFLHGILDIVASLHRTWPEGQVLRRAFFNHGIGPLFGALEILSIIAYNGFN
jgi:hypothetical protein